MESEKTIFVVDDDEDDRMLISEALHNLSEKVNVVEVQSGTDMYELLNQDEQPTGFRLILLDMNMPRMNGLELLKLLKRNIKWRSVPVIMLSTSSNQSLIREAYKLGVNVFVVKPVSIGEFDRMVKMVSDCFLNNFVQGDLHTFDKKLKWRNIMVIEDNNDHWDLMHYSLRQSAPYVKIVRVANRSEAVETLQAKFLELKPMPEIIFLDLYLPEREDGLDLLKDIRQFVQDRDLHSIPVIVFSYSGNAKDIEAALANQANAYLIKPTDISFFPAYLNGLCSIWANAVSAPE